MRLSRSSSCSLREMPRTGPLWMRFIKCCRATAHSDSRLLYSQHQGTCGTGDGGQHVFRWHLRLVAVSCIVNTSTSCRPLSRLCAAASQTDSTLPGKQQWLGHGSHLRPASNLSTHAPQGMPQAQLRCSCNTPAVRALPWLGNDLAQAAPDRSTQLPDSCRSGQCSSAQLSLNPAQQAMGATSPLAELPRQSSPPPSC